MKDSNPFNEEAIAKEWVQAVEGDTEGSREKEIYPLLRAWIENINPKVIVDIGAGQGICASKINLSSRKYIGIEPSRFLIERAKELYPEENKTFIEGSAYNLPIESGTADAVFSVGVWFHLEDLDAAHAEVARILKPDGKLLIVTADPDMNQVWESFFINVEREGKMISGAIQTPAGLLSKNVFYLHSKDELINSLNKHGFSILSITKLGTGRRSEGQKIWMALEAMRG